MRDDIPRKKKATTKPIVVELDEDFKNRVMAKVRKSDTTLHNVVVYYLTKWLNQKESA